MTKLPPVKLIKDVLDGLLGKELDVAPGDPLTSVDAAPGVLALYVDDGNTMRAVAGWDLPAAANIGAAVGLIPRGAAEDAVEQRYLSEALLENLSEVSNVLASVFQMAGNPHLRLEQAYRPVNAAPADATALLYRLGQRIDLTLDVPGYGPGRLSISMVA